MPRGKRSKLDALRQGGFLNPRPERVTDELFHQSEFFDARDLLQVKYEMVRRVQVDAAPVTKSTAAFGFSRPSFYEAQAALERGGLAGLMPKKRGPRGAHKLGKEIMAFIGEAVAGNDSLGAVDLVARVKDRFGVEVHPRSIERALERQKKDGPR